MRVPVTLPLSVVAVAFLLCGARSTLVAQSEPSVALTGRVSSAAEGPMEGVLVSVRRAGSTVTTTVVTDREGLYRFPRTRLEPGDYSIRIRAVGYDLETSGKATVAAQRTTTLESRAHQDSRSRFAADQRGVVGKRPRHRRRACLRSEAAHTVIRWS
jgi:Carboxypeptidase regulatory-like domain